MSQLQFEEETHNIIGAAMRVSNQIGHGFFEKVYENALIVDFKKNNILFKQQQRFTVRYENEVVGEYIPDIVVYDEIVVEVKTIARITAQEKGQALNYLKVTNLRLALVLNFKHSRLEWERVVL